MLLFSVYVPKLLVANQSDKDNENEVDNLEGAQYDHAVSKDILDKGNVVAFDVEQTSSVEFLHQKNSKFVLLENGPINHVDHLESPIHAQGNLNFDHLDNLAEQGSSSQNEMNDHSPINEVVQDSL